MASLKVPEAELFCGTIVLRSRVIHGMGMVVHLVHSAKPHEFPLVPRNVLGSGAAVLSKVMGCSQSSTGTQ